MKYLTFSNSENVRIVSEVNFKKHFKVILKTDTFLTKCSSILNYMIKQENMGVSLTETFLNYPLSLGDTVASMRRSPKKGTLKCYKIIGKSQYVSYIMSYILSCGKYERGKHVLMILTHDNHYSAGLFNKSNKQLTLLDPFLNAKEAQRFIKKAHICNPIVINETLKSLDIGKLDFIKREDKSLEKLYKQDLFDKNNNRIDIPKVLSIQHISLVADGNCNYWNVEIKDKSFGTKRIRKSFSFLDLPEALEYRDLVIRKIGLSYKLYYPKEYFCDDDINKFTISYEKSQTGKYINSAEVDKIFTIDDINKLKGVVRLSNGQIKAQLSFDGLIYWGQSYNEYDIMKAIEERDLMCLKLGKLFNKSYKIIFSVDKYTGEQVYDYNLPVGKVRTRNKPRQQL